MSIKGERRMREKRRRGRSRVMEEGGIKGRIACENKSKRSLFGICFSVRKKFEEGKRNEEKS
jgi:hypothetical protein